MNPDESPTNDLPSIKALLEDALLGLRGVTDQKVRPADVEQHLTTALRFVYEALANSGDYGAFHAARTVAIVSLRGALAALQNVGSTDPTTRQELTRVAGVLRSLSRVTSPPLGESALLPRPGARKGIVRASLDEPALLDPERAVLHPAIPLPERDEPEVPLPPPLPDPPPVTTMAELEALMAANEAAAAAPAEPEPEEEPPDAGPPSARALVVQAFDEFFGDTIPAHFIVLDRARSCLEDLAALGRMRRPTPIETWTSGESSERRLLRKVDAIVACGADVLPHLVHLLEDRPVPDPELLWANLYLFGSIAGDDARDQVIRLARIAPPDDPEVVAAVRDAFALMPHLGVETELRAWLGEPSPARRSVAVAALGRRGGLLLDEALRAAGDPDPEVALAAATALGTVPGAAVDLALRDLFQHADERVVRAALVSSFLRRRALGVRHAQELCAAGRGAYADAALFVALGGGGDAYAVLRAAATPTAPATVVQALGWYGHVGVMEYLCGRLESDEEASAAAAGALWRLTGAALTDDDPAPEYEKEELPFVRPFAPPPPPVDLTGKPKVWTAFWRRHGHQAKVGTRYRFGHEWSARDCLWEVSEPSILPGPRELAHLELCARTGGSAPLDREGFVARQQRDLYEWHAYVERHPEHLKAGAWPVKLAAHAGG